METIRSNDHIRWGLSNGCGHASSKNSKYDRLVLLGIFVIGFVLAECLSEALGENLICVGRTTRIQRAWFGIVHASFLELPAQMR
nr:hypothetical protein [Halapricum desulfuricans]